MSDEPINTTPGEMTRGHSEALPLGPTRVDPIGIPMARERELMAENKRLKERVAELETAIKPMANLDDCGILELSAGGAKITSADIRAASVALIG